EMGRTSAGGRGPETGRRGLGGRPAGVSGAALSKVLAAGRIRVHRRHSAHVGRQVQEERASRTIPELPARGIRGFVIGFACGIFLINQKRTDGERKSCTI